MPPIRLHPRLPRPAGRLLRLALAAALPALAQTSPPRQWTDQQGRTLTAALVSSQGGQVVLQLPNGTRHTLAVTTLSAADQAFLRSLAAPGATAPAPLTAAAGPAQAEWPAEVITVNPKAIEVTPGLQDAAARQYHYRSGAFEFIANAPLAGTVVSEIATDFELLLASFSRLPWGWQPQPRDGRHFQIYLTETDEDFLAIGGDERSSAGSKNNKNFIRFSALGLKKVGAKYQYDARQKDPGNAAGMTTRAMAWDYRTRMAPWALSGLETYMRRIAYRDNGTVKFVDHESELKKYLKTLAEYTQPDPARMLKHLRADWETRDNSTSLKALYNRQLDSLLLFYFFAHLDGDGRGSGLHAYFKTAFASSSGRTNLQAMLDALLAGRDDARMAADMREKFGTLNIKLP